MHNRTDVRTRSFLTAIGIILVLMIAAYVMTLCVPGGSFERNAEGVIEQGAAFTAVEGGLPFWKFLCSPVLVLFAEGGTTVLAVLIFLLVIGGIFEGLTQSGLMQYMLDRITFRYGRKRYRLMAAIVFFFMAMGSLIGSFEECVPLVPIVVTLAVSLGWDAITGLAMSLLAVGCGFAAGVFNPFTVGVAQKLAGLGMFSGAWLRAVGFVLIYFLLMLFIRGRAKKIEKPLNRPQEKSAQAHSKEMSSGLVCFAVILGIGILLVLASALPLSFAETLQSLSLIIMAIAFLIGGIAAVLVSRKGLAFLGRTFLRGVISMLPAVAMIMMASSIRYILEEAQVLDTVLYGVLACTENMPRAVVILFIYLIVLIMNFFIASGSAKAVMMIPLIVPLASAFQIPAQLCVLAFAFGDGFSNILYPTNPALLISLGLADCSYAKWFKWSWKFQLANLLLTSGLLLFGLAIGY